MKPTQTSRIPHIAATVMAGCLLLAALDPRNLLAHTSTSGHPGMIDDPTYLPAGATTVVITPNLTLFKDALPVPQVLRPSRQTNGYRVPVDTNLHYAGPLDVYDIPMLETNHQFHTDLPPIKVWGYAGQYPGPTIEAKVGVPILVNWINQLTNNDGMYPYWLLADPLLFHQGHTSSVPPQAIRTVVHLHGAAVLPRYDGYPTNWFLSGESDEYFYPNIDLNSDGQTLWYHDHAIGVTANNVYAGLAGFYLTRNEAYDAALGIRLPSAPYEIPLVFQDRDFAVTTWTNNGVVLVETNLCINQVPPWHTYPVVNGKIAPYLPVEPRPYRFRILNGTGFRSYALQMLVTDAQGNVLTNAGTPPAPQFTVIGNEDGYLHHATNVSRIATMPGERVDVVVDFSPYTNLAYPYITVVNAFGNGLGGTGADVVGPPFITNLMQFRVNLPLSTAIPTTMNIPSPLVTNWVDTETMRSNAVRHRSIELD
ncbi:MAG: multicopper oxidase domain-containing protein, partial [Verrucomicrobiales bacterium]|nr:multicopper oxidase domain-containing protein [Verrucomicrobiales bacterium]